MRLLAALASLLWITSSASAAGVSRPRPAPEAPLWTAWRNTALPAAAQLGGYVLPSTRGVTMTALTAYVNVVSGGGAGNTVITITDGTNTCTATISCVATQSLGAMRVALVNGAGTGCVYAPGAVLSASVTTAGCTTTQPSVLNLTYVAAWR